MNFRRALIQGVVVWAIAMTTATGIGLRAGSWLLFASFMPAVAFLSLAPAVWEVVRDLRQPPNEK